MASALNDVLRMGWKHGPLGCLGDCNLNSVPCKTGAHARSHAGPPAQPQMHASGRARRALGAWAPWVGEARAVASRGARSTRGRRAAAP
jgi:hypothetical protein